ncbi:hypothetical protein N7454_007918 [Penicillium verhagenii]|nr:hypothetical protein N7454_007918 [Penicillium verhagenii]
MVWHHASVSNATEFGPNHRLFRTTIFTSHLRVQKRANKISAAQQYQFLPEIRQVHVNQLIAENRLLDLQVEWSCVYAKERKRACKARNAHPEDYEVVSMSIILMKRPVATKTHFRTPMGDLVDLGVHFGPRPEKAKLPSGSEAHPGSDHELTNRSGFKDRFMTPFSGPRRSQTFSGEEEVGQDRVVHEPSSRPATAPSSRRRLDLDHGHNWADNDDEDESYAE